MEHSLCFSFSSILFHSCAQCSCAAPAHPRCVCGPCPKRHLPSALSPLCPLPTFTQQSFLPVLVLPQESQWHCRLSWSCYQICLGFLGLLSRHSSCLEWPADIYSPISLFSVGSFLKALLSHDICKPPDSALWAIAFDEFFLLFPCSAHIYSSAPF